MTKQRKYSAPKKWGGKHFENGHETGGTKRHQRENGERRLNEQRLQHCRNVLDFAPLNFHNVHNSNMQRIPRVLVEFALEDKKRAFLHTRGEHCTICYHVQKLCRYRNKSTQLSISCIKTFKYDQHSFASKTVLKNDSLNVQAQGKDDERSNERACREVPANGDNETTNKFIITI